MARRIDEARREAYFRALSETGNQAIAAERARVSLAWAKRLRRCDPGFAARIDAARAAARRVLSNAGGVTPPRGWGSLDGEELVVRPRQRANRADRARGVATVAAADRGAVPGNAGGDVQRHRVGPGRGARGIAAGDRTGRGAQGPGGGAGRCGDAGAGHADVGPSRRDERATYRAARFQAATCARAAASIVSSAARSWTCPRWITARIARVAVMSRNGLRSSRTRSATLPGAMLP